MFGTRAAGLIGGVIGLVAGLWAEPARAGDPDAGSPRAGGDLLRAHADGRVRFDGQTVIRAAVRDQRDVMVLTTLSESIWSHGVGPGGTLDVQIARDRLPALADAGIAWEVMIGDLESEVARERAEVTARSAQRDLGWFENYKTLAEISDELDAQAARAPELARVFALGASLEGRAIRGIRISGPDAPGNARSDRPAVFFMGCQHAREWVSPMTIMYFGDRLLALYATDARVRTILDSVEVILVPVVNPDGYQFSWTNNRLWRKTRRPLPGGAFGVDPNRNWDVGWGLPQGSSIQPTSEIYRGTAPFTEPETTAVRNFLLGEPRVEAAIDFHSYSELILSPRGWTSATAPESLLFTSLNGLMRDAIASAFGKLYTAGPLFSTIYPVSGGSADWFYEGHGNLGWGWELRDTGQFGFLLPPDQILPTAEENFRAILVVAEQVRLVARPSWADGTPIVRAEPDASTPVRVRVRGGADRSGVTLRLWSRLEGTGGAFVGRDMTAGPDGVYAAALPAAGCGRTWEMYVESSVAGGRTLLLPELGAAEPLRVPVRAERVAFVSDGENAMGWTLNTSGTTATTGRWEHTDPAAAQFQPENDATPSGTMCFFTDGTASPAAPGTLNGAANLVSPEFTLDAPCGLDVTAWRIDFRRWLMGNAGQMVASVREAGGGWRALNASQMTPFGWNPVAVTTEPIPAVSGRTALRFAASGGAGTLTEAGVDDVRVSVWGCPWNPADVDRSRGVDLEDFFAFFNAWDGRLPAADVDCSGDVDLDDFFAFLNAFAAS